MPLIKYKYPDHFPLFPDVFPSPHQPIHSPRQPPLAHSPIKAFPSNHKKPSHQQRCSSPPLSPPSSSRPPVPLPSPPRSRSARFPTLPAPACTALLSAVRPTSSASPTSTVASPQTPPSMPTTSPRSAPPSASVLAAASCPS